MVETTFAIPTCAFGVYSLEELLVCLACPFETCVQLVFIHLVVVINELLALRDRVIVI
jgi:hypothetical protein